MKYEIGTMTAEEARAELLDLKGRINAIDALFDRQTGRMPSADWPTARGLLSALKDRVDMWYRLGGTLKAEEAMNQVEELVFFPAITDIHSHLDIRRGSRPDQSWGHPLYDCRFDIGFWLPQLDKEAFKDAR
jgi:hypothetical protein